MDNLLFVFAQDGERWECRPSGLWAHFGFGFFLFGAALLLFLSGMFFWNMGHDLVGVGFGAFLLFGAGVLIWQASRYWRLRRTPLTVDGAGRVSYGQEELCPAGSVRSVQIVPDPQAESGDCKVVLERADGNGLSCRGRSSGPSAGVKWRVSLPGSWRGC